MNNCAVIGANGFLGRSIVNRLIWQGLTVYGIYHHNSEDLPTGCKKTTIEDFVKEQINIDCIFFSAGSFSYSHSQLVSLNCDLLKKIIDKYPASRIIYISSTNVYGFHDDIINEDSFFNSPTLYGRAKLSGEFIVSSAPSFAILRLTYLYGKGLDNGSFLPTILHQGLYNKKIIISGKGQRKQDYLHVEDAVELCIRSMNCAYNDTFLGATGKSYSNLEVAQAIASCIDNCVIEFQGEDSGTSFFFNPTETCRKLAWGPVVDFFNGIKDMTR